MNLFLISISILVIFIIYTYLRYSRSLEVKAEFLMNGGYSIDSKASNTDHPDTDCTDATLDKLLKLPFTERLAISLCKDIKNQVAQPLVRYTVYKKIYAEFSKLTKSLSGINRNKGKFFLFYFKRHARGIIRDFMNQPNQISNRTSEENESKFKETINQMDDPDVNALINTIFNLNEPTILLVYPILKVT